MNDDTTVRGKKEERDPSLPTWLDVDSDPWKPEWLLFGRSFLPHRFDRQKTKRWSARCDDWAVHATMLACIKYTAPDPKGTATWKESRMDFLNWHLDVLDSKIGWLLNFNTLLLIAINVLFSAMYNLVPKDPHKDYTHSLFKPGVGLASALVVECMVFGILWLIIVALCMFGERRLVWGDLGKDLGSAKRERLLSQMLTPDEKERAQAAANADARGLTPEQVAEAEKRATLDTTELDNAEREHVRALIVAIVKRTNKFRIATFFTWLNILDLVLALITGLWLLGTHYY